MDPNYWQTDGSINSASTFKSCLQEQKVSVAIQESDDSADVYNIVLKELANDGVTPAKLLTFPVTLKAKSGERTPDKTSDSGNDSDQEEIYCAQVLASIYEERLKIPQDKILNVLHCIQCVHCKRIESTNIDLKIANSASNQFTSRRRTPKLQQRMSSFDCSTGGSEHNQLEADPRFSNVPFASKTLGRMHSYQKPKNIVSYITSTLSGSQNNINSGDFWLEGTADFWLLEQKLGKKPKKKAKILTKNYHSSRGVPLRGEQDFNETSSSVEEVPDRSETWQNLAVVKFLAQLTWD